MTAEFRPPSKKTEMIEVRVAHEAKRDFLAACRRQGRTASDVIRDAIDRYIAGDHATRCPQEAARKKPLQALIPRPLRRKRYLAIAAVAAGFTALAALPSAAQPHSAASCSRFQQLDANHDGQLTYGEFEDR